MKLKLLKDITIPAGTIFSDAPTETSRAPGSFVEAIFNVGDSKDTFGCITYMVGERGSRERAQVSDYFQVIPPNT